MKCRDKTYDMIKGVAIILMVLSHAMEPMFDPVRRWISLFHMSVFFIAVGVFYKTVCVESFHDISVSVRKKIVRIWWPYVLWGSIFILLHNIFWRINIYTADPSVVGILSHSSVSHYWKWHEVVFHLKYTLFMMDGAEGVAGAFWFLRTLLFSYILYMAVDFFVNRMNRENNKVYRILVLSIVVYGALALSRTELVRLVDYGLNFMGGRSVMVALALMHTGVLIAYFSLNLARANKIVQICCLVSCFLFLVVQSMEGGGFTIGAAKYSSVWRLLSCALAGWYMLEAFARLILVYASRVGGAIAYLGAHTMPILLFHFLAFKIVNYVGVYAYGMSPVHVAAFPCAFHGVWWCLAYTVVGCSVPLLLNHLYLISRDGVIKHCERMWRCH